MVNELISREQRQPGTVNKNSIYSFKLGVAEANRLGQLEAGKAPSDPYAINNPVLDRMRNWGEEQ